MGRSLRSELAPRHRTAGVLVSFLSPYLAELFALWLLLGFSQNQWLVLWDTAPLLIVVSHGFLNNPLVPFVVLSSFIGSSAHQGGKEHSQDGSEGKFAGNP